MSGRIFGYTFGRVPTWLLDAAVSDRAVRLFALLTRYADREGRGFPGRRALAERLRCSVDSVDRALRELVDAGAVRVEERWEVAGDGGRLTNDYHLLEHREEDPGRTAAACPAACVRLPQPRRCGCPRRGGAAPERTRTLHPPRGGRGGEVLEVITPMTAEQVVAAWMAAYRDRAGHEPTERAARQLTREAGRLLADGRPVMVDDAAGPRLLESRVDRLLIGAGAGGGKPGTTPNPVDTRTYASVRRAVGEAR